jgi:hypothetical protein
MRHVIYWVLHTFAWAAFWVAIGSPGSFLIEVNNMALWIPIFILYSYPLAYWAVPRYLLNGKILEFLLLGFLWGIAGMYLEVGYKDYIIIPLQTMMHPENVLPRGPLAFCFLCITTSAAIPILIQFFKHWSIKQQEWLNVQQEKFTTELKLLKAQVHPHFLFNTLNNIYSFALDSSPKTPGMILKLSNLLSYMLYDCRTDEVRLEKELDIMQDYIALESERYGDKIAISWNVSGDISDQFIAPLLLLPFIENAFKHGTSDQIEQSWLKVNIAFYNHILEVRISNSKNTSTLVDKKGIGIANIKKRLAFTYPGHHSLKINDTGNTFDIFMTIDLPGMVVNSEPGTLIFQRPKYEAQLSAY